MTAVDTTFGGVGEPAVFAETITPHDTNELTYITRAIYVGGAGDVNVVTLGGDTALFKAVPVGSLLPIRVKKVLSTSTTASYLLGLR